MRRHLALFVHSGVGLYLYIYIIKSLKLCFIFHMSKFSSNFVQPSSCLFRPDKSAADMENSTEVFMQKIITSLVEDMKMGNDNEKVVALQELEDLANAEAG